jgi:glycosyltransferase involved in cell wall biosynthesis
MDSSHESFIAAPWDLRAKSRAERLEAQDAAAESLALWADRNSYYYSELVRLFRLHVPPKAKVLHIGCGLGDMLAAVEPRDGLGIDLSPRIIDMARRRHAAPHLHFDAIDPENFSLDEIFDFILIDHALADMHDIQSALECARRVSAPHTRIILSYYSALWSPMLRAASRFGLRRPTGEQNWLSAADFDNLLKLAGFEVVCRSSETLVPKHIPIPGVNAFFNRFLAKFWPFNGLALTQMFVARPLAAPKNAERLTCTIVIPTRNERGNIADAVRRIPQLGAHTEIIFVDGNSSDGTVDEIERVIRNPMSGEGDHVLTLLPSHPLSFSFKVLRQSRSTPGKGPAVRQGFAAATGDVLMILDADLTVPPEDLPRFFNAIASGAGEFINGTRLVYPMERQAMRILNKVGNRFFSMLFTWLLGQRFRDTLCGTKAVSRRNYEVIAANRSHFGDFDPFGDFDLIFGAAKANLKIIEVPVRYRARTYGETNIHRFRHGWLLLKMSWIAFKRLKLR